MQPPHSYAQRRPYDRGRRFYDEISRKHDPVDPHSLEQKKLLYVLDVSPRAAVALLDHADGDIFKLMGRDYYPAHEVGRRRRKNYRADQGASRPGAGF